MSLILEALRRADAQRQRTPSRGLHALAVPLSGLEPPRSRRRLRGWLASMLVLLALVLSAAALWWAGRAARMPALAPQAHAVPVAGAVADGGAVAVSAMLLTDAKPRPTVLAQTAAPVPRDEPRAHPTPNRNAPPSATAARQGGATPMPPSPTASSPLQSGPAGAGSIAAGAAAAAGGSIVGAPERQEGRSAPGLPAPGAPQGLARPASPQPARSQAAASQPAAVQPAPFQPAPSQPAPSQPAPSQSAPSQSAPSQPAPSQPVASRPSPSRAAPPQPARVGPPGAPAAPAAPSAKGPASSPLPRDAPPFKVSGAVYSPDPAMRMVIANGQVYGQGAEVGGGITIEEIGRNAVVVRFRGQRYTVYY